MADEPKEAPKKPAEKCCDCRIFLISLLTSIIVVLCFHIGARAFKLLCASCARSKAPARCCVCMNKPCGPRKHFHGPKGDCLPPQCGAPVKVKSIRPAKDVPPPAPVPAPAK